MMPLTKSMPSKRQSGLMSDSRSKRDELNASLELVYFYLGGCAICSLLAETNDSVFIDLNEFCRRPYDTYTALERAGYNVEHLIALAQQSHQQTWGINVNN